MQLPLVQFSLIARIMPGSKKMIQFQNTELLMVQYSMSTIKIINTHSYIILVYITLVLLQGMCIKKLQVCSYRTFSKEIVKNEKLCVNEMCL